MLAPKRAAQGLALAALLSMAVGLATRWRALFYGFEIDDLVQRGFLHGYPQRRAPWDLYAFIPDAARLEAARFVGGLPWWTPHDMRMSFYRPLSSMTLALDAWLFGTNATLAHVHSVVWWCVLVGVMGWLWCPRTAEEDAPARAGTLSLVGAIAALVVYALDESHTETLLVIPNRHATIASALAVVALGLHLRARVEKRRDLGAIATFVVALLASEYAIAIVGYVVAFAAFERQATLGERIRRVAPFVALSCLYVAAHGALGYGTRELALYADPRSEPARFFVEASYQYSALLQNGVLGMPFAYGGLVAALVLVGVALVLREARPWVLGTFLALVPVCPALQPESSRQLVIPVIGISAAIGLVVARAVEASRGGAPIARRLLALLAFGACAAIHLVHASVRSYHLSTAKTGVNLNRTRVALNADLDDQLVPTQRVVLLSTVYPQDTYTLVPARRMFGHPVPAAVVAASTMPGSRTIKRLSDRELEISFPSWKRRIGPPPLSKHLKPGDTVALDGARVTLLQRTPMAPVAVRLQLDGPVDDAHWRFLVATRDGEYRRFSLPPVGETATTE